MADNKVAIDLSINAGGSAKSIKDLKQEIKDLKNEALKAGEGSKGFIEFSKKAVEAQEKINKLNESITALNPENLGQSFAKVGSTLAGGFQAAQGAMALFGTEAKDVEKALLKVQAATALAQGIQSVQDLGKAFEALNLIVKSNPIILLYGSIIALGIAVTEMKDKFKLAGVIFEVFSSAINGLIQQFKDLSDAIGLSNFKLQDSIDKQKQLREEAEKNRKINKDNIDYAIEYTQVQERGINAAEREIELMKLRGETADKILKAEIELNNKKADLIGNNIQNQENALEKEKLKDKQRALYHANEVLRLEYENKLNEEQKKKAEKDSKSKIEFKLNEADLETQLNETAAELDKAESERRAKELQIAEDDKATSLAASIDLTMEAAKREREILEANERAKEQIRRDGFNALSALGQIFINDSKKLEKFQKGLALTQIATDTALAISALVKASNQNPFNAATFGAAGIAQFSSGLVQILTNIAKAKQLLTSGSSASSTNLSTSQSRSTNTGGGVNITPVRSTTSTTIEREKVESGQSVVRAYVVESDITSSQKRISDITKKSKI